MSNILFSLLKTSSENNQRQRTADKLISAQMAEEKNHQQQSFDFPFFLVFFLHNSAADFCGHLCSENRSEELEDSLEKEDDRKLQFSYHTGETSRRPRFPEEFVGVRHERQRPKGSPGKPVISLRLVMIHRV